MANELLKYVEDQMKKGYKPRVIKDALIRDGYSSTVVDGVIDSVQRKRRGGAEDTPISPALVGTSHERAGFPKIVFLILFLGDF